MHRAHHYHKGRKEIMPFAIQEDMLPGSTPMQQFQAAQSLGLTGIEVWADGLHERVTRLAEAMQETGVKIAAVNMGRLTGYISMDPREREQAIERLRVAMADAADLGTEYVIVTPHFGPSILPDLTPFRTTPQLEGEMFVWFLRLVNDLATAMGVVMCIQPVNRYESEFFNTVTEAGQFCQQINDHPGVGIAAHLFHVAMEEMDVYGSLQANATRIKYMHLCDSNGRLPGRGLIDFGRVADTIKQMNYTGWLSLTTGKAGENREWANQIRTALPGVLGFLQDKGF